MPKISSKTRGRLRKLNPPRAFWRLAGLISITGMRRWMSTLHFRMVRYDPQADPAEPDFQGPVIFVFWHEYIPFPVFVRPHCGLAMLLSQHQDAEIMSHIAAFAGLETVRGSTNRGGTAALRELINRGSGMSLAITPDGPRGPRRKLAQGCIYLSSRLQIPIVPLGIGYDRPWRNRSSWDHFAIPRPFSRCRAVLGPRIQMPADLPRDDIEQHRQWIENQLNLVTTQAEDWAAGEPDPAGAEILYPRVRPARNNAPSISYWPSAATNASA